MHNHHFLWPMFWGLFALTIILVRRVTRHRERMRALDMTQRLVEKGVTPPDILMQALQPEPRRPRTRANDLRLGSILLAVAAAMLVMGAVISTGDAGRFHGYGGLNPLLGAAAFPGLIGLVFLTFGLLDRSRP